jgi:hypothetical protein
VLIFSTWFWVVFFCACIFLPQKTKKDKVARFIILAILSAPVAYFCVGMTVVLFRQGIDGIIAIAVAIALFVLAYLALSQFLIWILRIN